MKALILNIGDEVVSGSVVNTNASHISQTLAKIGITVSKVIAIRDNENDIKNSVKQFLNGEEGLLITTGGLGPTHDDITKEVISEVLGLKLALREEATRPEYKYANSLKNDCNVKQAYFPETAKVIHNDLGTADGVYLEFTNKIIVMLVGPPYENIPMLDKVLPDLSVHGKPVQYTDFILIGQSESYFENMLTPLLKANISINPYASNGRVRFRIISNGNDEDYYRALADFRKLYHEYIISEVDEDINQVLVRLLIEKQLTISFGESMTGGLLAKLITDISGASAVIKQSYVTYHNDAKINILGVDKRIIEEKGVVSKEVTEAMARGVERLSHADVNIAVSGDAGPTGDVGKVCYTIIFNNNVYNEEKQFKGSRDMIRIRAARQIFYHVFRLIRNMEN